MEGSYECAWTFKGKPFESDMLYKEKTDKKGNVTIDLNKEIFSFIYLITDNKNNKKYIGQKMFTTKKPVTKNKITKKVTVESDWKTYYSSSDILKQLVKNEGTKDIKREIIYICFSKGQANYLETKLQIELGCLENSNQWYNGIVNCKVHHTHVKMDKLQDKDDELLKQLYKEYRPVLV